jgi:hypothetical protein
MYRPMSVQAVRQLGVDALRIAIENSSTMLSVGDLDTLIDTLAQLRAGMRPPRPHEPVPSRHYPMEMNPSWRVDKNPLFDGATLVLRHAGLGWTAFAFPPQSLSKLSDALAVQVLPMFAMSSTPS